MKTGQPRKGRTGRRFLEGPFGGFLVQDAQKRSPIQGKKNPKNLLRLFFENNLARQK